MVARDGASSVQGTMIRVTRLNLDGSIDGGYPVLTTKGFITASFSPQFEEGDEINEKAADGSVCVAWKADDSLTRLDFSLSLCSPEPEVAAMIAGGSVIKDDNDEIIGYSSVAVGSVVGQPVAIEIWSIANIGGKPAADKPYWHWVFPYVKVRYEGDREFTNGMLANEFTGQALGNSSLANTGLNPAISGTDNFVTYREALVNPFSYVRSDTAPTGNSLFNGSFPATGSDITPYLLATSVSAGTPGSFGPSGATPPSNLSALRALGALGATTAWTTGQYVVLGDTTYAFWDGDSWESGIA